MWVLLDHKPGHTSQSEGLARALGWPFESKVIPFSLPNLLSDRFLNPLRVDPKGGRAAALSPPWPDVVISTGWRTLPITRWIGRQSGGSTRTVQIGRKGGDVANRFDAVVTCRHLRMPPHHRRIETLVPLHRVTPGALEQAAERWPDLWRDTPRPRVVLLVGGRSRHHRVEPERAARMAREVSEFASQANGCVVAVASRRTGPRLESIIEAHLGPNGRLVRWADVQNDNPYLGYLATADVIVATADSESMIAEAAASGKPVFIYPVAERVAGPWRRLQRLVMRIAHSRPRKRRGTVRPQQGAEYFCARLIEKGWIRPPRDVEAMGKLLIEGGFAQLFGGPRVEAQTRPPIEIQGVARQVRELLTWTEDAAAVSKRDGDDGWLEFPPPTEVQDPLVDSATAS